MALKTMSGSTERKGIRGRSWFSMFFWPAFLRVLLLDRKLEIWPPQADRRPAPAALSLKGPHDFVPTCTVPEIIVNTQIECWIRWTLEDNIALVAALKQLRHSYNLLRAGEIARDADQILAQVEAALRDNEKSTM